MTRVSYNMKNRLFAEFSCTSDACECCIANNSKKLAEFGVKPSLLCKYKYQSFNYTFTSKSGLVQQEDKKKRIIEALVNLEDDNIEQIKSFLEDFGFPLHSLFFDGDIAECNFYNLNEILKRVKKTALLMNELKKYDHITDVPGLEKSLDTICDLTIFLMYQKKITFDVPDPENGRETLFDTPINLSGLICALNPAGENNTAKSNITDKSMLKNEDANEITERKDISEGEMLSLEDSLIILPEAHYLPHGVYFCNKIKKDLKISGVNENGTLVFNESFSRKYAKDKSMQSKLITLANQTLALEFNGVLKSIDMYYSYETLSLSLDTSELLFAMYLATMLQPLDTIFKECKNPRCKNLFLDSIKNNKRKYCCDGCRNAFGQANHRIKQKESR